MSSVYQTARTALACPRCRVALPPNESVCYNCGLHLAPVAPAASSLPNTSAKTAVAPQRAMKQQRQGPSKRASIIYVLVALVVIFLFASAGFRAAGISPGKLVTLLHSKPVTLKESYPDATGTPLFVDQFAGDGSGWNQQSVPGNYMVSLSKGALALENDKQSLLWEVLPGTKTFSNFQLTVDAKLSKGDQNNGYGVYIRGAANQQSDLASYYRFELYGDGSFAIFKGSTNAAGKTIDTKLVDFLINPAIAKQGKVNHIRIIARGPRLSFVVNDHLLQTVTDTSYSSGSIALFVSNLPEARPGAQAQFSNLAVYGL